jgi:hypothetical protein
MPRISSRCPPGVFCLSPGFVLLAVVVTAVALFVFTYTGRMQANPIVISSAAAAQEAAQPQPIRVNVVTQGGGDDRYTRAPKPERDWLTRPDWSTVWNAPTATLPQIATRGIPESYQSMGVITTGDGQVLPLYGRRTASRSDRFQYYTRTDTYNPVQLPIRYKNRDCQDDVGCEELMDGEDIKVSATGKEGKVNMYRFSGPTYIPAI